MKTSLLALAALAFSTNAHAAAVLFNFSSASGNLGPSETYTDTIGGTLQVTAKGFDNSNVATDLYGKALGGNENGIGLANDPSNENEISFGNGYVQLDVSKLIAASVTNVQFFMNSTTDGEGWYVLGGNTSGVPLAGHLIDSSGLSDQGNHLLPSFGLYTYYDFFAKASGNNVLLGGLSATSDGVPIQTGVLPEPATWTMMLLGFGLIGGAMRRQKQHQSVRLTYA